MRMNTICRKAKHPCSAKMKGAEIGRSQLTQSLVERVGVFPQKTYQKLLKDLTVVGGMR